MENTRRNFIKKGGAIAALSLAGLNGCRDESAGSSEDRSWQRLANRPVEPYMKIAFQAKTEPEGGQTSSAFSVGYMKALVERVIAEG